MHTYILPKHLRKELTTYCISSFQFLLLYFAVDCRQEKDIMNTFSSTCLPGAFLSACLLPHLTNWYFLCGPVCFEFLQTNHFILWRWTVLYTYHKMYYILKTPVLMRLRVSRCVCTVLTDILKGFSSQGSLRILAYPEDAGSRHEGPPEHRNCVPVFMVLCVRRFKCYQQCLENFSSY